MLKSASQNCRALFSRCQKLPHLIVSLEVCADNLRECCRRSRLLCAFFYSIGVVQGYWDVFSCIWFESFDQSLIFIPSPPLAPIPHNHAYNFGFCPLAFSGFQSPWVIISVHLKICSIFYIFFSIETRLKGFSQWRG